MTDPEDGAVADSRVLARSILDGIHAQDAALLAGMARRELAVQHRARQMLLDHANSLQAAVDQDPTSEGQHQVDMIIVLRDLAQGLLDNTTRAVDNETGQDGREDYHFRL
ncbi:hypothetical protein AB0M43_14730 [Longispora sp. NPDC051575]|uniref:hypothetical protein n=1 Tax=Longispora sp. NPDC051575 TaxID=3154943 RepID=UPI003436DAC9